MWKIKRCAIFNQLKYDGIDEHPDLLLPLAFYNMLSGQQNPGRLALNGFSRQMIEIKVKKPIHDTML